MLTRRARLDVGTFASSVWLYQEIGAAVAFDRKPLILVEDGMDEHYAGEQQKGYEYIPFDRVHFEAAFEPVAFRLDADLDRHHIPRPPKPAL